MPDDDRRMHEGRSRHLDEQQRGHSRQEDAYTPEADAIGVEEGTPRRGATEDLIDARNDPDRERESALGGKVATRSSTAPTPEDERTQ